MPRRGGRQRSLIWVCIVVRRVERLCESVLCCLGLKRKVTASCFLYNIYHRTDHPTNEYLNRFIAARNTRASTALGELALVIPRCRTDQFSRSFLPTVVRLWKLLPSGVFSVGTLSSFKSGIKLCLLLKACLYFFIYISVSFFLLCSFLCSMVLHGAVFVYMGIPFPSSMFQIVLIIIIRCELVHPATNAFNSLNNYSRITVCNQLLNHLQIS